MKNEFDCIVIGGGAAGLYAAFSANSQGAKVCLVERNKLGGECTWSGCIPSKALIKSAHVMHEMKTSATYGITPSGIVPDVSGVLSHVRGVVEEVYAPYTPEELTKKGITVVIGEAHFIDNRNIEIGSKPYFAPKYIIATGSRPSAPPIEGLKELKYLTNENIFSLERLPKSLIILGGGPIGVELSQALFRLGVQVTVVEMDDHLLPREDREMADLVEKTLREEGMRILTGRKAVRFISRGSDGSDVGEVAAFLEDKNKRSEEIVAQNVLVATGRVPNLESLGLEAAGVGYTKKGITVNKYLQTANKNIFACGDVVGPYQFAHVAGYQAYLCVRNALFKRLAWEKEQYDNIVWATFTHPELAHLGMTESEAKEKGKKVKIYYSSYIGSGRAYTDREKNGLVKLITDDRNRILGAHIFGAQASELLQGFIIAKSLKIPVTKIARALYIYPTLSELIKRTAAQPLMEQLDTPIIKAIKNLFKNY